jgi:hypothetical protein
MLTGWKARHIRQEVPAIVGAEPQPLEPDAETLGDALITLPLSRSLRDGF